MCVCVCCVCDFDVCIWVFVCLFGVGHSTLDPSAHNSSYLAHECCIYMYMYTALVSLLFGTVIPISFNILLEMLKCFYTCVFTYFKGLRWYRNTHIHVPRCVKAYYSTDPYKANDMSAPSLYTSRVSVYIDVCTCRVKHMGVIGDGAYSVQKMINSLRNKKE